MHESRITDFKKPKPQCIKVSGSQNSWRKSFASFPKSQKITEELMVTGKHSTKREAILLEP